MHQNIVPLREKNSSKRVMTGYFHLLINVVDAFASKIHNQNNTQNIVPLREKNSSKRVMDWPFPCYLTLKSKLKLSDWWSKELSWPSLKNHNHFCLVSGGLIFLSGVVGVYETPTVDNIPLPTFRSFPIPQ
jgi:hypothetical protein